MSIFYDLPASELVEGLSTADGQDIIGVSREGTSIVATVYTPRPDDQAADEYNYSNSETRLYDRAKLVNLAVFDNTNVDLSTHKSARSWSIWRFFDNTNVDLSTHKSARNRKTS